MPTLFLDGGDFLEGHLFYKSGNGKSVFDIVNNMGYDSVVIGNHDWQMGTKGLDELLGRVQPSFPFLGANFKVDKRYRNIHKYMDPYKEFEFDGVKIAILGITTNSLFYSWRVENGKISSPTATANKYAKKLKHFRDNDFVIALTHIGHNSDQSLVKRSRNIDLVVGGHGHDFVYEPKITRDLDGKSVPVLQAGEYGKVIGKLIVDFTPGQRAKIVSYKLVPVYKAKGQDQEIGQLVEDAKDKLDSAYGKEYLNEVIGNAEVDLINSNDERTLWGEFVADAFREAFNADVAIHSPKFTAENIAAGGITRLDLMKSYPRFFELDRDEGSDLYSAKVKGWLLKLLLNVTINTGYPLHFSGVDFKIKKVAFGLYKASSIRVNHSKLRRFRSYRVAIPEVIARGGVGISKAVRLFLRKMSSERVSVWKALENKVKRDGTIGNNKSRSDNTPRRMIPQHKEL